MADLVAVMREGELQQLAPPDEIYDRPANRFVATFVGNPPMNVLDGRASTPAQLRDRRRSGSRSASCGAACAAAGATALGVRPEDLEILPRGNAGRARRRDLRRRADGQRDARRRAHRRPARDGAGRPRIRRADRLADRRARGPEERVLLRAGGNDGAPPERPCQQAKGDVRMTPEMPPEGSAPREDGALSRRDLLRTAGRGRRARRRAAARHDAGLRAGQAPRRRRRREARDRRVRGRRDHRLQEDHPAVQAADRDLDPAPDRALRLLQLEGVPGRAEQGRAVRHLHHGRPLDPAVRRGGHPRGPRPARHQGRRRLRQAVPRPGLLAAALGAAHQGLREQDARARRAADDRRPPDDDLPQRRLQDARPRRGTSSSPWARRP